MNRGAKKLLIVLGAICVGLYSGCTFLFPSSSLHYKLSVDVDDNGVTHHGEGVIEVLFESEGPFLMAHTPQWHVYTIGQAFPVDIGTRGTLFVLLNAGLGKPDLENGKPVIASAEAGPAALLKYFGFAVNDLPNGLASKAKIDAFARSKTAVDLKSNAAPLLVHFRDIADPNSAELVDPEHLDSVFGSGVAISKVRIEITDESTTKGIEKRLKWLSNPEITSAQGSSALPPLTQLVVAARYTGMTPEQLR